VAKLIYSAIMSLDGYIADENGTFDWAEPEAEVHALSTTSSDRSARTCTDGACTKSWPCGRRSIRVTTGGPSGVLRGRLALSRQNRLLQDSGASLHTADATGARVWAGFRAADEEVGCAGYRRRGPDLAAQAIRAGLVDTYQLLLTPIIVGSGKQALPDGFRQKLELVDERRFGGGMVYLHYQTVVT
jgi:dihydrofolate reductase